jgi:DNA-binding GntR family transcriptional regulator
VTAGRGAQEIYDRLYRAVLEQRLAPGTKLTEERLAAIFSAGRASVRTALARLEHDRIVEQIPNRGSFVAQPSAQESDDVLDARRLIEPELARRLAATHSGTDIQRLRGHVAAEFAARDAGDESTAIRLSGEFHNELASLAGNSALAGVVRSLSAVTCLVILVHHAPTAAACRPDEHGAIVDLIAAGRGDAAADAVVEHLDHVGDALVFDPAPPPTADLETLLGAG